ncbi:MAG: hypothetical protein ACHQFZ_05535 [Acidimicrobiales bacterium]
MRLQPRRWVVAVALGGLVGGAVSGPLLAARAGAQRRLAGAGDSAALAPREEPHRVAFTIAGNATGLYPGATVPLTLTVANLRPAPLTVLWISTTVVATSAPCGPSLVHVAPFIGRLPVAARGTATATVSASMTPGAPDGCQGAHFHFLYHGEAIER